MPFKYQVSATFSVGWAKRFTELRLTMPRPSDTDEKNRLCGPSATVAPELPTTGNVSFPATTILGVLDLHVGFLRKLRSVDDLSVEMTALEEAGCERIVVENGRPSDGAGMLKALTERLADGDALTVWSFDSVAASLRELIDLALDLEDRNVRFRSLSEGFDTHGRQRVAIRATLVQLREFKQRVLVASRKRSRRQAGSPRRPAPIALTQRPRGRPVSDQGGQDAR